MCVQYLAARQDLTHGLLTLYNKDNSNDMKSYMILGLGILGLSACQTTSDSAQGGFINGLNAINSGAYEKQSENLGKQTAAERSRQADLRQDLRILKAEYASLQRLIRTQSSNLSMNNSALPLGMGERVNSALIAIEPSGEVSTQLNELGRSIAAARALVAELANLS
jgi:TolA-binding protein